MNETFLLSDRQGLKWIFQLRVGLSHLKSHKFNHNFNDILSDACSCSSSSENTYHFFLVCLNYNLIRVDLFKEIKSILLTKNINFDNINLVNLLLYGNKELDFSENRKILESTVKFILLSGRFN